MHSLHMAYYCRAHSTKVYHLPEALQAFLPEQGHLEGDSPFQGLDGPRKGSHEDTLLLLALIPFAHKQCGTHCCTIQSQCCFTHFTVQCSQIFVPVATTVNTLCMGTQSPLVTPHELPLLCTRQQCSVLCKQQKCCLCTNHRTYQAPINSLLQAMD